MDLSSLPPQKKIEMELSSGPHQWKVTTEKEGKRRDKPLRIKGLFRYKICSNKI
jgi:hypothetical protein